MNDVTWWKRSDPGAGQNDSPIESHTHDRAPEVGAPADQELVNTGVDLPDIADDKDVDPLTREDVDSDPGEATRKLPRNDQVD